MLAKAQDAAKVLVAALASTAPCRLEGLQVLLKAHAAAGAQLQLASAGPAVRRLLQRTGPSSAFRRDPGDLRRLPTRRPVAGGGPSPVLQGPVPFGGGASPWCLNPANAERLWDLAASWTS